jgi:hypothetical protein
VAQKEKDTAHLSDSRSHSLEMTLTAELWVRSHTSTKLFARAKHTIEDGGRFILDILPK